MPKVVISEFMDPAAIAADLSGFDTLYDPGLVDRPEALAAAVAEADALIVRNRTQVRGALLAGARRLRIVGRLGVGLDNIDVPACRARGITVQPATGANDGAVAEYVVATALLLLRGAYGASEAVAAGTWPRNALMGREIAGKRLGLVGFGSIARETARRAAALGMAIAAHDPFLAAEDPAWTPPYGPVRRRDLEALIAESDVLSLHVPLTAETRGLIDATALARMPAGAVLINAARGGIVDEAAVAAALRSGHLGGAALDVFDREPLDAAAGAPFAGVPNLILTPHIAGVTQESNVRVSAVIAAAVRRHLTQG
ncbi:MULTISPECIES: NAD(P)-dependent oxidoreductase [Methylobacterium]|uniref:D-isomer specific 2-hydroxyacid dehydrogenase NAD-binding protein n=2 Tax=Methylobacterium TaxID=407 RepID=A0A089P3K3_9HYPH|nr:MULTISPECIES: NAD(P)-dependent oxidoreductase [Methylobacterium]KOX49310.1 3-phosphoglycerate dehydrogenase [Streptomyces purpurogeneiscleroticus]AIQ92623.1 D-isomer specific 2-hydroxyacid dehydrogenase NAD-binding protein [Methylobacterium oryzae CBMB20]AWV15846.1 3-phosphoglycerate dehydrogenase [Methylobacterium sp. XJLW]MBA9064633.1 (S)-sulfolactate dehydrogenase [Methylobacterium fujisawaense]MDH3032015.1 NAD(P)-dependent oxidoreductase [Methylobacterium fujisawaense]